MPIDSVSYHGETGAAGKRPPRRSPFPFFQELTELRMAVDFVCGHPTRLHPCVQGTPSVVPVPAWWRTPFLPGCQLQRSERGLPSTPSADRVPGQSERPPLAPIRQEDTDLTVLNATCRARILSPHTRRLVSLFEKPCFIDNQDTLRVSHMIHHIALEIIAYLVGIPLGSAKHR